MMLLEYAENRWVDHSDMAYSTDLGDAIVALGLNPYMPATHWQIMLRIIQTVEAAWSMFDELVEAFRCDR